MKESQIPPEDDARLTAYAFGELPAEDMAAVEALLCEDESARGMVAELRRLAQSMSGALAAEPVPERRPVAVAPLSNRRKPAKTAVFWASLGVAASLAVVTGVALHSRHLADLPLADGGPPPVQMANSNAAEIKTKDLADASGRFSAGAFAGRKAFAPTRSPALSGLTGGNLVHYTEGGSVSLQNAPRVPASRMVSLTLSGGAFGASLDYIPDPSLASWSPPDEKTAFRDLFEAPAPFLANSPFALDAVAGSLDLRLSPGERVYEYTPDPGFAIHPSPYLGTQGWLPKNLFVVHVHFAGDPKFVIWAVPRRAAEGYPFPSGATQAAKAASANIDYISGVGAADLLAAPPPQTPRIGGAAGKIPAPSSPDDSKAQTGAQH